MYSCSDREIAEWSRAARALMGEQRYDDALQIWRDVVVYGQLDPWPFVEIARCLCELGALSEALEALETALAVDGFAVAAAIDADWNLGVLWSER